MNTAVRFGYINCPTKPFLLHLALLATFSLTGMLTGCQTVPVVKTANSNTSSSNTTSSNSITAKSGITTGAQQPVTGVDRPLLPSPIGNASVVSSQPIAGLTDIMWDVVSIKSKNPQTFINRPYLYLQAAAQRIGGSTGCNALNGSYQSIGQNNLKIQALAGHMSCADSLAQEADIMDTLGRVATYQLQQNMLYLYDAQGGLLMTARSR
ncbi:MAG: META domain-containing protein [Moraxellaceae bacterium]|nr:MAG: META domain-containing protein [Moraxellaceae bacterium]